MVCKIIFLFTLLTLLSCKTAEQIKREQQVDSLSVQVRQNQTLSAEVTSRIDQIELEVNKVAGKLEEVEHKNREDLREAIRDIKKEVQLTEESNQALREKMKDLEDRLAEQQKYISEVLESLKTLSISLEKKTKEEPAKSTTNGFEDFKKGRHKDAKIKLMALLDEKNVKAPTKANALLYLGLISFKSKNYEESLTFFSRLFTDYPKSNHNMMGLLYLGRSFHKMGKVDEAKNSFKELIRIYPNSKEAVDAASFLKGM